ncbi:MAG TPA: DUF1800 family protein, partial [Sediminibacterium sp.]|nr:DUF1800 family protein [Sediminibacterium sp.]
MPFKRLSIALVAGTVFLFLSAFLLPERFRNEYRLNMPYKQMGLTNEQAAAHLLSRFSFGPTPGQVQEVVKEGLDTWLEQQLAGNLPDEEVNRRLPAAQYEALKMDNEDIVNTYLNPGQIIRIAAKNKLFDQDSVKNLAKPEYRAELKKIMDAQGYRLPQELQRQLINQKVIRAAYGQNQLQEVLTDFWFNHFNVSLTKGQCQQYVLTYERDAIRPHVLGRFEDLLVSTAQHPAMLEYLDNASSVSNDNAFARKQETNLRAHAIRERLESMAEADSGKPGMKILQQTLKARKTQGLNENFAREVMELHTLGVDGGYTQKDVTEVARALTGWSIRPMYKDGPGTKLLEHASQDQLAKRGYILAGDFMFRGDKHDEDPKTILGKYFPANGGYQEGLAVLHL